MSSSHTQHSPRSKSAIKTSDASVTGGDSVDRLAGAPVQVQSAPHLRLKQSQSSDNFTCSDNLACMSLGMLRSMKEQPKNC